MRHDRRALMENFRAMVARGEPRDAEFVLNNTRNRHGFDGASAMERLPVQVALTEQTGKFKQIGRG